QPMALAHSCFGDVVAGPFANLESRSQSGAEVPIRQVREIYFRHGLVIVREHMHRVDTECPQDLKSTVGEISDWVAQKCILPVDDAGEPAILQKYIARPIISMQ